MPISIVRVLGKCGLITFHCYVCLGVKWRLTTDYRISTLSRHLLYLLKLMFSVCPHPRALRPLVRGSLLSSIPALVLNLIQSSRAWACLLRLPCVLHFPS